MSEFNKTILMGRICKKPELRFTPGGDAVCDLRMAVSEKYKLKSGETKENTLFIDAVIWRKQAETCAEHLVKGQLVLVEGNLKAEEWENKEGQKIKVTFDISGREYNGKYFVNLVAWKLGDPAAGGAAPAANDEPPFDENDAFMDDSDIQF